MESQINESGADNLRLTTAAASRELTHPVSGLANDYLNLFNELVMMLEQLPQMPELLEELYAWRPTSYQGLFPRFETCRPPVGARDL